MSTRLQPPVMRRQRGVTMIELMVALVISMLLAIGVMLVQRNLALQKSRGTDIGLRDSELRAAMDLVTHDLSGAGFLLGGTQVRCGALFTYDSAAPAPGYYVHYPATAVPATNGTQMAFAPSLTLSYPLVGSTVPSDVLVVINAASATRFGGPMYKTVPSTTYNNPLGTGTVATNPVDVNSLAAAGDVGVLQLPDTLRRPCLRVPITTAANAAPYQITSGGATMPAGKYGGFAAQMTSYASGLQTAKAAATFAAPGNGELFQSTLFDLGATASPPYTSTAFYVSKGTGAGDSLPTLMRGTYSLLDDSQIASEAIAAGVVSLQALFGVDPGGVGAVTAYETWAHAKAHPWAVMSVRVALVARTLYADPETSASAAYGGAAVNTSTSVTVPSVAPLNGTDDFKPVPIETAYTRFRFTVQVAETAVRSW